MTKIVVFLYFFQFPSSAVAIYSSTALAVIQVSRWVWLLTTAAYIWRWEALLQLSLRSHLGIRLRACDLSRFRPGSKRS